MELHGMSPQYIEMPLASCHPDFLWVAAVSLQGSVLDLGRLQRTAPQATGTCVDGRFKCTPNVKDPSPKPPVLCLCWPTHAENCVFILNLYERLRRKHLEQQKSLFH